MAPPAPRGAAPPARGSTPRPAPEQAPGTLLVTITGNDAGQFGTRPLDELSSALSRSFSRVHVLVGSKAVYLTVAIAQHLSRTGDPIQIYSDPASFESRLPGTSLS